MYLLGTWCEAFSEENLQALTCHNIQSILNEKQNILNINKENDFVKMECAEGSHDQVLGVSINRNLTNNMEVYLIEGKYDANTSISYLTFKEINKNLEVLKTLNESYVFKILSRKKRQMVAYKQEYLDRQANAAGAAAAAAREIGKAIGYGAVGIWVNRQAERAYDNTIVPAGRWIDSLFTRTPAPDYSHHRLMDSNAWNNRLMNSGINSENLDNQAIGQ
ncbi:hypothetical protein [Spirobacillus cienkowskii]|uniref:hypothetical protein n=1 Tax=Spirobacillus cienkowskii TaxID=495820 RepID=UPI0030CF4418